MISQESIGNLIKTFHLAVTNLRIYPTSSQMVIATFDTLFKIISSLVEDNNVLTWLNFQTNCLSTEMNRKAGRYK